MTSALPGFDRQSHWPPAAFAVEWECVCERVASLLGTSTESSASIEEWRQALQNATQVQPYNKHGELCVSIPEAAVSNAGTNEALDCCIRKFAPDATLAALQRIGTLISMRLQPAALLRLALAAAQERQQKAKYPSCDANLTLVMSVVKRADLDGEQPHLLVNASLRAHVIAQSMVGMLHASGVAARWVVIMLEEVPVCTETLQSCFQAAGMQPDAFERCGSEKERDAFAQMPQTTQDLDADAAKEERTEKYLATLVGMARAAGVLLKRWSRCKAQFECFSVGPVKEAENKATAHTGEALAFLRDRMARMLDQDTLNQALLPKPTNTLSQTEITLCTTTSAALCGLFMEARRGKGIQLSNSVPAQLLERGQPAIYLLYTYAKVGAIVDTHVAASAVNEASEQETAMDVSADCAQALSDCPQAIDVARDLLGYAHAADESLIRCEPCVLVAAAVRTARALTRLCRVLRVKDQPVSVAAPRAHLLAASRATLHDAILRLGLSPLERM
ncbi:hypothetical protein THASP1DRAFT_31576 [Thamnocephalis sphaerospora]|uniref:DALR anticodon binding domain-containing protein n=1 Tax=Thamnocephalis sphaerospora TaxID=78915 RepID=A0A4P9XK99_9FUNG|nr:hypothetical protein THASP1DRAFT_31961 [Thamnocephalis sphaerospora]RKP06614.1 hypothetical protein THASP1DRAFT_31576 [Thamnocephalis sphaerospora]|eukprot:RKP06224.1 hypothetical protein THASP1DRAFT_31961 [Thamnocephalis sphaerospora]